MAGYIGSKAVNLSTTGADINGDANIDGDLSFRDNDKAIFGAGSDLQIYHNGNNSYVQDVGTGKLHITSNGTGVSIDKGTSELMATFDTDGAVTLYYDNSAKIATTSTGIQVTGNISNASGDLTLDVAGDINLDAGGQQIFFQKGGTTFGQFGTESTPTNFTIESTVSDGDIVFKGNDGGSNITALTLDMSQAGRATFNEGIVLKSSTGGDFGVNINTASGDSMKLQVVDTGSAGAANGVITVTDGDLILSPSANVGIGTSSPSANLEIAQSGNNVGLLVAGGGYNYTAKFESSDAEANIIIEDSNSTNDGNMIGVATNDMYFITNASERMRIDSSGNVGIGTSSPSALLHLESAGPSIKLVDNDNNPDYEIKNGNGSFRIIDTTAGSDRINIDASGNLLVGCAGLPSGGGGGAGFETGQSGGRTILQLGTTVTTSENVAVFYNPNGSIGSINLSGSATSYNTSSDYRLKTDAQPMTGASARVQALNPVNFEWIADGTRVDGFLAHEAQVVVPEAVTGEKDAVDADGNPVYQGIDQSKLVPLLTAALQEALDEITDLKARVATLEAN
jgi:hypothetical protein